MKGKIAALIAGIVIGMTGTAAAATSYYWSEGGSDYSCEGIGSGVTCKGGGLKWGSTKSYVYVQKGQRTFACVKWQAWRECFEG